MVSIQTKYKKAAIISGFFIDHSPFDFIIYIYVKLAQAIANAVLYPTEYIGDGSRQTTSVVRFHNIDVNLMFESLKRTYDVLLNRLWAVTYTIPPDDQNGLLWNFTLKTLSGIDPFNVTQTDLYNSFVFYLIFVSALVAVSVFFCTWMFGITFQMIKFVSLLIMATKFQEKDTGCSEISLTFFWSSFQTKYDPNTCAIHLFFASAHLPRNVRINSNSVLISNDFDFIQIEFPINHFRRFIYSQIHNDLLFVTVRSKWYTCI